MKYALILTLGLFAAACQPKAAETNVVTIPAENFQQELDGKAVNLYTLANKNGMTMQVTNFGTRIVNLWVPDNSGEFCDVVAGYNTLDEYLNNPEQYFGASIGRYGNRIAGGQFTLDGTSYQLQQNERNNTLHGGIKGYHDVVFDAEPYTTESGDEAILFTYLSPDGEMGFPGNLTVKVRMVVPAAKNEVQISYEATTDAPTVVNLTNHSYFNLSGEGSPTIEDHPMKIYASSYTPTDASLIPTGEIAPVAGTPMDFTDFHAIGERIGDDFPALKLGNGYDHNYVLDNTAGGTMGLAAEVWSSVTGILMQVYTDEPGVQFYSGNGAGRVPGKSGKPYGLRSTFCLETQNFPDAPNQPGFPSSVLRPGETYTSACTYAFDRIMINPAGE